MRINCVEVICRKIVFMKQKKCKWISINTDYSQWKFKWRKKENLTQIHQPTWCCINWCDRTQVSGNPQFLFHCLFCLHFIFLSLSHPLSISMQRHRDDIQFLPPNYAQTNFHLFQKGKKWVTMWIINAYSIP